MSYRIRDLNGIRNNQLNSSVSKQQYTIPRADRWKNNKSEASYYNYYNLPSTNNKKAFNFGTSNRKVFEPKKETIPSPNKYFQNMHNSYVLQTNSIAFAKGREECKNVSLIPVSQNPGPGHYHPNPQFTDPHSSIKYSIRAKTEFSRVKIDEVPGPGRYNQKTTWLQKNKILSNDPNYGTPLIRPSNIKRQLQFGQKLDLPFYSPNKTMKGEQTFNTTKGFSIGKGLRPQQRLKTEAPGPGTYNRFSQFI